MSLSGSVNASVRPDFPMSVYFIQSKATNLVKIGVSHDASERFKNLQIENADALLLVADVSLPCRQDALWIEKQLHFHFGHLRDHAEWFRVDDELSALMLSASRGESDLPTFAERAERDSLIAKGASIRAYADVRP